MATAATESPAPVFPDYMLDPDAVLKDQASWRHGSSPNYSGTRKVWEATKKSNHAPGSLEQLVENLVKNWEIEASHKLKLSEWRTIDLEHYTFSINGGAPQDGEHMLKVGTYNAIITPNQYYDPKTTDLEKSHETFRNMMPNFAWEVVEVYSGPPVVTFKWRHWGFMKRDYVGWNDKGEQVTIKAHGGALDIQGITVAKVNDKLQVTSLETWFDPMDMFNQMKPNLDPGASDVEVLVDDHKLDKKETAELLATGGDGDKGVEKLLEEVAGNPSTLSITETIEGDAIANGTNVHVLNPTAPSLSEASTSANEQYGAEHSEERVLGTPKETAPSPSTAPHPIPDDASSGGGCPFLSGNGNQHQSSQQ